MQNGQKIIGLLFLLFFVLVFQPILSVAGDQISSQKNSGASLSVKIVTFPEQADIFGVETTGKEILLGNSPLEYSLPVSIMGTFHFIRMSLLSSKNDVFLSKIEDLYPNGIRVKFENRSVDANSYWEIGRENIEINFFGREPKVKTITGLSHLCEILEKQNAIQLGMKLSAAGSPVTLNKKDLEITPETIKGFWVRKDGYEPLLINIPSRFETNTLIFSRNLVMTPRYFSQNVLSLIAGRKYDAAEDLRQYQMHVLSENPTPEHQKQLAKLEKLIGLDNAGLMMLREKYVAAIDKEEFDKAVKIKELIDKEEAQYKPGPSSPQSQIVVVGETYTTESRQANSGRVSGTVNVITQQKPYYELADIASALESARLIEKDRDASGYIKAAAGLHIIDVLRNLGQ